MQFAKTRVAVKLSSWPCLLLLAGTVACSAGELGGRAMTGEDEDDGGGGTAGTSAGVAGASQAQGGAAGAPDDEPSAPMDARDEPPGMAGQGGADNTAGTAGGAGTQGPLADAGVPPDGEPVFVAVGYAGRRIRSTDLGRTWTDDQRLGGGGDDQFLLRGVGYGAGRFVAVGWKILSSPDGKTWTEHRNPQNQWLGGVKFGNGRFGAAGGFGFSAHSLDGMTWMAGRSRGSEAARSVAFGGMTFTAATDNGNWWTSSDGNTWTRGSGGHSSRVVYCDTAFADARSCSGPWGRNEGRVAFGAGVWISVRGSTIERSEDGTRWTTVSSGGSSFEDVTFGYAP